MEDLARKKAKGRASRLAAMRRGCLSTSEEEAPQRALKPGTVGDGAVVEGQAGRFDFL